MNPDWKTTIPDNYVTDLTRTDHASNVRNFYRKQGAELERFKLLGMLAEIDPQIARQLMMKLEQE